MREDPEEGLGGQTDEILVLQREGRVHPHGPTLAGVTDPRRARQEEAGG